MLIPNSETDAAYVIRNAAADSKPLSICGGNTRGFARLATSAEPISSRGLTAIVDYDPAEMVMTVKSGTPVAEVEAALAANRQMMAFEPMDHRGIMGTHGAPSREPTIGGVFAANVSGPRRLIAGAARDSLLGIRFVNGRGEIIRAGGRVMKNVTGLDLVKLLAGSHGTLGFLTEVTFRVLPMPPLTQTVVISGLDDEMAAKAMASAIALPVEISGAAHLPQTVRSRFIDGALPEGEATVLRLEGLAASVEVRAQKLASVMEAFGSVSKLGLQESLTLWRQIRDVAPYADGTEKPLWRVSVAPSAGYHLVSALRLEAGVDAFYDWQGGLVWMRMEADPEAELLRRYIRALGGGHATLIRASEAVRAQIQTFEPLPDAIAALSARIKAKLDPAGQRGARTLDLARDLLMQTSFTPEQLEDPHVAESEKILRRCVHCGFCTATCPTYLTLGNELDSPRGRIYLIKDMLENGRDADEEVVTHIDRCLSCLSCVTTCPSGVDYMHLVDHARVHIENTYQRPLIDRLIRSLLAAVLPYPARFRTALKLARLGRPFAPLLKSITSLRPFGAMLELAPRFTATPRPSILRGAQPVLGIRRGRVAILSGCAQSVLDPGINVATVHLLARFGVEVVLPQGEGCCGALVHHMGREGEALAFARNNVDVWTREIEKKGLDAIIITASGCGTTIKDYGHMLRLDPAYAEKAAKVSALAKDITEYLVTLDLPRLEPKRLNVAYHSACSMQHGQKITIAPKLLLKNAGFTVRDPAEGHLCCGSAGTYNILQPEISGELKARKVKNIEATKPDIIATGNIGCMTQIGSATAIPIVHTVELLEWAYGGDKPEKLAR